MHNWINCHTLETNTTVQINYTSIKCKKKKKQKYKKRKWWCWTINVAECWRTDAFEVWYWRRRLRTPWTARRSHQPVLRETSPEYSLEGLMLKLKLQYFVHLMRRTDSLQKTLILGKIEGRRRRGQQSTRQLDGITDSVDMSFSEL